MYKATSKDGSVYEVMHIWDTVVYLKNLKTQTTITISVQEFMTQYKLQTRTE